MKKQEQQQDPGPPRWHSRTIAGISLEPTQWMGKTEMERGWSGDIAGQRWVFVKKAHKRWQGFTGDHLTGTPINLSLARVVLWVIEEEASWKAKLKVRRKAGTRMVDPIDKATKAS